MIKWTVSIRGSRGPNGVRVDHVIEAQHFIEASVVATSVLADYQLTTTEPLHIVALCSHLFTENLW